MPDVNQSIIDRIAKLLRLSKDDGATEGEVENALRFARKLMEEHSLTEDQIPLNNENPSTVGIVDVPGIGLVQWVTWLENLAGTAATLTDTKPYYNFQWEPGRSRRAVKYVRYVGYPTDAAVAAAMVNYLITVTRTMARMKYGSGWGPQQRSYALGFSARLWSRAHEIRAAVQAASTDANKSGAIVLAKQANVQAWMDQNLSLRKPKTSKNKGYAADDSAYLEGSTDADKVDLKTENILG